MARLQLSEDVLGTHVAWDLGVAALAERLAARLDAFAILHNYSRLVIDVNRPLQAPDSIVSLSEHTAIAANATLTPAQRHQRIEALFEPYHNRIATELAARARRAQPSVLVCLHSFTPVYAGVARPWHVGVLYGRDGRLAERVLRKLRQEPGLRVGDNEPYAASELSDHTLVVHGERRRIPHVELEVRQDLLATAAGQRAWAGRLATVLKVALAEGIPPLKADGSPLR